MVVEASLGKEFARPHLIREVAYVPSQLHRMRLGGLQFRASSRKKKKKFMRPNLKGRELEIVINS
jgi:hypothetical protein